MSRRRMYDPEHDALWEAIRRLSYVTTIIGLGVIAVAVSELWR
jgi:hypothetical protein